MLNYAAKLGPRTSYRFFLLRPGSLEARGDRDEARSRAGLHALLRLTERWLVLAEFPFVVNPPRLAFSGWPYIENYRWKPELGTRFHLFDRATGKSIGPFETEARFGFHHVNAYEEDGEVVADICTFSDPQIVEDLYLERLRAGKPIAPAHLERFRISPEAGTVSAERLIEEEIELPRINYGRCNERPYRYVWGVGAGGGWIDRIVKADVVERGSTTWSEEGCFPGEPVFVAAPDAGGEDEGVLLSVVLDGRKGNFPAGARRPLARRAGPRRGPAPRPVRLPRAVRTELRRGMEALLDRHPLRVAMEARDLDGVADALAPDVVLYSPITASFRFVGGTRWRHSWESCATCSRTSTTWGISARATPTCSPFGRASTDRSWRAQTSCSWTRRVGSAR